MKDRRKIEETGKQRASITTLSVATYCRMLVIMILHRSIATITDTHNVTPDTLTATAKEGRKSERGSQKKWDNVTPDRQGGK